MRTYAAISPLFWARGSGKRLRGHPEAQLVALYLMSCQAASMVGIFHLSMETVAHDTGLPLGAPSEGLGRGLGVPPEGLTTKQGAWEGLRRCSDEGIAYYDSDEELFWLPKLARWQIGERLKRGTTGKVDNRATGIRRELEPFKGHRFYDEFLERYAEAYLLEDLLIEAPSKSLPRDYGLVLDPVLDPGPDGGGAGGGMNIRERAAAYRDNPNEAQVRYGAPGKWPELMALWKAFQDAWGFQDAPRSGVGDPRVDLALQRYAEGRSQSELERAIRNSRNYPPISTKREHQRLKTILRDAEQVDTLLRFDNPQPVERLPTVPRQPDPEGFDVTKWTKRDDAGRV